MSLEGQFFKHPCYIFVMHDLNECRGGSVMSLKKERDSGSHASTPTWACLATPILQSMLSTNC
jgi:hypothetical protein